MIEMDHGLQRGIVGAAVIGLALLPLIHPAGRRLKIIGFAALGASALASGLLYGW